MRISWALLCLWMIPWSSLAAAVSVLDDQGRTVTLEKPAQRIVALAPHLVENLYAIGAGERIVATVAWADYPEPAKSIPRVGSYHSLSVEAVLGYQPDLVVIWASGNGQDLLKRLEGLGLAVYVSEPRRLEDIAQALQRLGVLTGRASAAQQQAAGFQKTITDLRQQYEDKSPVSVFYQIWHDPLQTINGQHLISAVLSLCGGRNVFSEAVALAPRTSIESVLKLDPQVIIAGQASEEMQRFWGKWTSLRAVQQQQLVSVNPDLLHRHSTRIAEGARALCLALEHAR